jgi:hypothetical protein
MHHVACHRSSRQPVIMMIVCHPPHAANTSEVIPSKQDPLTSWSGWACINSTHSLYRDQLETFSSTASPARPNLYNVISLSSRRALRQLLRHCRRIWWTFSKPERHGLERTDKYCNLEAPSYQAYYSTRQGIFC